MKAIFLDRDGVLMQDTNYVGHIDRVLLIPTAIPALQRLHNAGYLLFVVTNQSGVGRGYFTREAVEEIHTLLNQHFNAAGIHIEHYYVCPHHPEDNCDCRKPHPKNILAAARDYKLDLAQCVMVGDRTSDIQTGVNAGTRTALVLTGAGRDTLAKNEVKPDCVAEDLTGVADLDTGMNYKQTIVGRDACRLGIAPCRHQHAQNGAIPQNDMRHRALQNLRESFRLKS